MNIQERLAILFRRLEAAPPAASADEAMDLVCRLIEEVEDEFCPLPRQDPPPKNSTGRMYRPQRDSIEPFGTGGLYAKARRHLILCSVGGEITIIYDPSSTIVFRKKGR